MLQVHGLYIQFNFKNDLLYFFPKHLKKKKSNLKHYF